MSECDVMRMMVYLRLLLASVLTLAGCSGSDYQIEANIRYAPYGETVLDLLQPRSPALKDRIGVLVIHGGGWVGGAKEDMLAFSRQLVDQGFVVANVDYRLAGSAPAPAAVQDVLSAAKWLRERASDYKVDTKRIIAAGVSAGGELALLAAMLPDPNDFGPVTRIAAVIDLSGIADVAELVEGAEQRDFAQQWIPADPARLELAKKLSPLTYVRKDLPPVLAIHGDADAVVPYDQSVKLTAALKAAGAKSELITVSGGKHEFTSEQTAALWPQIFKWMKKNKLTGY